ncbi:glycosyltransferase family 2 protein [Simiduia aestuariiviva]|uniref:Glycosyltransferase involved in cell wall biosynthesis n=1 Tax=Simiduia aestuariiviva TaxID=1510459 RepID=A0A839UUG7_9GAMM|nr:glycosyltransferase family 2 protein [Simiduia aestuariiviva]MBB3170090.1 glycosyltransferase involved in cell wall biosynthesis [Simiduia aestuariiviva]
MSNIKPQPLVSVVIATYNMAQYLPQAIDSIQSQTWQNLEIIVVDDGSTDDTPEVMKAYEGSERVRYIRNENQGQPKAKNCGVRNAQGEFIAFCDADDLWEPFKLEKQMPLFNNLRTGVVYSEVSHIDEHNARYDKPPAYTRYRGKVTNRLLYKNFVPFGTAVIRRQCVSQNGMFDEDFRMGIDWDLWLRYSLDWEFDYVTDKTYVYREWSGQMSTNYRGRYDHAFRILTKFASRFQSQLNSKALQQAWADMHIGKGNIIARQEGTVKEPLMCILKGISTAPGYWYGWKSLIKLALRRP